MGGNEREFFFPRPIPCSPVQVPSISSARSTMSVIHFSTAARSFGSLLLYMMLSWKLPSPIWPKTLANRPRSSISFFEISVEGQQRLTSAATCIAPIISGSRERGTATSVDQTSSPSRRKASMLHNDSFRADQSVFCSSASTANSKSPLLCDRAIALTRSTFSFTPAFVPENLFLLSVSPSGKLIMLWNPLEEHGRNFLPLLGCGAGSVYHSHLDLIHNLHSCYRYSCTHHLGSCCCGIANRRKRHNGHASILWYDCELQRDLGNEPQGALRSDKEVSEIVAGR